MGRRGVLGGPMAKLPRWRLEQDLDPAGPTTAIGATKSAFGPTLRLQPRHAIPLDGLLAALKELEAPLVVVEEGEAPITENDIIMHRITFFKITAPHIIGRGGRMLRRIEDFCGVFLSLSDVSSEMVEVTIYGTSRGCAMVQFIKDMLIEGVYSVIDTLARHGF